jgi:hypothetical protein
VGYCQAIINPKLQKLRQKFAAKLKPAWPLTLLQL